MVLLNWLSRWRRRSVSARKSVVPKPAVVRQDLGRRVEWLEERCVLSGVSSQSLTDANWFAVVTPDAASQSGGLSGASAGSSSEADAERLYLVRLTDDALQFVHSPQAAQELFADSGAGLRVVQGLGLPGQLLLATGESDSAIVSAELRDHPNVAYFEEDRSIGATETRFPNENEPERNARFAEQYGLHNVGQSGDTVDPDINAPEAWHITTGTSEVIVSVIDSGVDFTHPDLYLNIWLNNAELPAELSSRLFNRDGVAGISFRDLNHADNRALRQDPNNAASPLLLRDLNSTGYIDAGDLLDDPLWSDGIDTDDNDFEDDLVGWDFHDNDNRPFDEHGHGTHVAGILGAIGDNGEGVVGVAWTTSILPLRFLDENNTGELNDAIEAINYQSLLRTSTTNPANIRVSNNSWGVSGSLSQNLYDAVAATRAADILFVAAAGNGDILGRGVDNDQTPFYPANLDLPNVISVGAFGPDGSLARFSNFGDQSVDIAAPGVGIVSTAPGGTYLSRNGTSMATPFVTGTAALVLSKHPAASALEVRDAILVGAVAADELAGLVNGHRRLNAERAINAPTFAPVPQLAVIDPVTESGGTSLQVRVTFEDEDGVDLTSLGASDIEVTRTGFSTSQLEVTGYSISGTATAAAVTYTVRALGGTWEAIDNGVYQIVLRSGEVADADGVRNSQRVLGSFEVHIPTTTVFFVNTTADSLDADPTDGLARDALGRTSLRAAIMQANATAGLNTIVLPDGEYFIARTGAGEDQSLTGDWDITDSLTILGADVSTTILDGNHLDRLFDVRGNTLLTLQNVTLQNGAADRGGAIRSVGTGTELALNFVRLTTNTAELDGGAIYNTATLRITDAAITDNQTTSTLGIGGGGVYTEGMTTISRTTVARNTTQAGGLANRGGGGIWSRGNFEMENSTISGNTAPRGVGGGLADFGFIGILGGW